MADSCTQSYTLPKPTLSWLTMSEIILKAHKRPQIGKIYRVILTNPFSEPRCISDTLMSIESVIFFSAGMKVLLNMWLDKSASPMHFYTAGME